MKTKRIFEIEIQPPGLLGILIVKSCYESKNHKSQKQKQEIK